MVLFQLLTKKYKNMFKFKKTKNFDKSNKIFCDNKFHKTYNNLIINGKNNEITIIGYNQHLFKNLYIEINGNNNKITIPSNTNFDNCKLKIYNNNVEVKFPESPEFRNVDITMEGPYAQKLIIGDNTTIRGITIKMLEQTNLIIGQNCMFARGIEIQTSDFHSVFDKDTNKLLNSSEGNSLIIGNNCWIANFAVFLKNSALADNTIVGNSSVITKKFTEENIAIAGNPARIIKNNVYWTRERPYKNLIQQTNNVNTIDIQYKDKKVILFNFIPLFKIKYKNNKTKIYLFNFIYLFSIKK